ncbi:hypothetical protein Q9966_009495, partial [Columba livia]
REGGAGASVKRARARSGLCCCAGVPGGGWGSSAACRQSSARFAEPAGCLTRCYGELCAELGLQKHLPSAFAAAQGGVCSSGSSALLAARPIGTHRGCVLGADWLVRTDELCLKSVNGGGSRRAVAALRNHTEGARLSDVLGFGVTGDQHLFKDRGSARGGRVGTA